MVKGNAVLMVDVGGDTLKMAEFVFFTGGSITLRKFAFRKLAVEDEADIGKVFAENYREMLKENNFSAKQVRLSLPGQSSFSRLSKLPPLMGNKSAINRIVEFEAKQTVPYPMNEVVWDYQLIRHVWDDTRTEQNEDGTTMEIAESHEEYEALFVAVKNDQVSVFTDPIQDSGMDILSVEIAPVALFNAAKGSGQCRDDECVLLLNIGAQGANLMIADHNRAFIRSIPIAGNSITSQIAKEFGIGFQEAEELKRRHGFVALGGAYEEPELEVAATISKIARNVMTRLHGEVSRSINVWRSQHGGHQPERVLLAGGASSMLYITDFFQEKLRLPVAYLNTFSTISIEDSVNKEELQIVAPMFQELIGMSIRNVTQCPIDISLIPNSLKAQKALDRKKPYFYISAVSLVLCLSIFAGGVSRRLNFDKSLVEMAKGEVEKTTKDMERVNLTFAQRNGALSEYEEPMRFLSDRTRWTDMLNELETFLPDTMWLTKLEGLGDPEVQQTQPSNDGGGFGGLFGGGAAAATTDSGEKLSPLTKMVKELNLAGYTLVLKRDLLENELKKKLKTSKYFMDGDSGGFELKKFVKDNEVLNLTNFVIRLKLKEPIRK